VLDQVWNRLGIGAAIARSAAGRKLDAAVVERVLFALLSKAGGTVAKAVPSPREPFLSVTDFVLPFLPHRGWPRRRGGCWAARRVAHLAHLLSRAAFGQFG